MQNRYACDVGDFGKYGLLKALCNPASLPDESSLKLGVVWYLVPDEKDNADGKYKDYLNPSYRDSEKFKNCDSLLYEKLQELMCRGSSVQAIQENNVLPCGTVFFDKLLDYNSMPATGNKAKEARLKHRLQWVKDACAKTEGCDIVFFDPDNGLETSLARHRKTGPKYLFFDELNPFWHRKQSLVIYQHTDHTDKAENQARKRIADLKAKLKPVHEPFALLYRRGTCRAFIVIPAEGQGDLLRSRAERFLQTEWGRKQIFSSYIY
jgi:hypothetical protein